MNKSEGIHPPQHPKLVSKDSLEKTVTLGKTEGKRRGQQMMRWLDGITDLMDLSLSKLREMVKDRCAALHRVTKSRTQLSYSAKSAIRNLWLMTTEINSLTVRRPGV